MKKIFKTGCLLLALTLSGCQAVDPTPELSEILPDSETAVEEQSDVSEAPPDSETAVEEQSDVSEAPPDSETAVEEQSDVSEAPPDSETAVEEQSDVYETEEYVSRPLTETEFSDLRNSFSMLCYANPAIIALTEDGNVITWGYVYEGTIGNGIFPKDGDPDYFREATPYFIDFSERIVSVGNDSSMMYALTGSGDVFAWGDNSFGECGEESSKISRPQKLKLGEKIKKVSIGTGATWVFLTEDGRVLLSGIDILTFERIEDLQENIAFELDRTVSDEYIPLMTAEPGYTELELPFRCKDIACGMLNYALLSEEGDVYVLGTLLGDYDRIVPNLIHRELYKIGFPEKITEIESGTTFVTALSESGKVYLYGKKEGVFFDEAQDTELSENIFLKGGLKDIVSVKCAQYCTLAIDANGDLWGFGIDQWGALDIRNADMDTSTYEIICQPRRLDYSDVAFCDADIVNSAILTKNGSYHVQGASAQKLNDPFGNSKE